MLSNKIYQQIHLQYYQIVSVFFQLSSFGTTGTVMNRAVNVPFARRHVVCIKVVVEYPIQSFKTVL